ncbi:hypothetical protein [Xanthomonas phaseoli]|uniref:hypothetical protein n=1 Tax=Xanthomonas phaseoli TaxID=1985254 RepID=UPI000365CD77|nr:hypothetical protein [Xanthomonas phaseoli]RWU12450.1 hypothetical protein XANMN_23305 [Xanthomonas phaseoli pv. manihotis str. CIO151]UEQ13649.1 hypothetical protein K9838_13015 [Xanthomonas phaseoli pv. manihotis]
MKRNIGLVAALVVGSAAASAHGQVVSNAAKLAVELEAERTTCSAMASELSGAASTASLKDRLASEEERTRIEMDTRIYAVSHGRRESTQYMLDRMSQLASTDSANAQARVEKGEQDRAAVAACVSQALEHGKGQYANFKKGKRTKKDADEGSAVMTAWMVNVQSIEMRAPQGTEESKAEWDKAKAHAELESM